MKKQISRILIVLGVLSLCAAAALAAYNLWDERRAGQQSKQVVNALQEEVEQKEEDSEIPDYVLDPQMDLPSYTLDGTTYIGILDMPTIQLSLPVNNEFTYQNLKASPCRYQGSPYTDDLIVCAHNYRGHFGEIELLHMWDRLTFTDMSGNVFTYEVRALEVIGGTQVEQMIDTEYDLTLFTCTLDGQSRVTIRCERVKE